MSWLRLQRALWIGRFRSMRADLRARWVRPPRPGLPDLRDDGTDEAEQAWFFYGLSFLFRPAGLLSAALTIESQRKARKARRRVLVLVIAAAAVWFAAWSVALARGSL